jgi:hypothetical protein
MATDPVNPRQHRRLAAGEGRRALIVATVLTVVFSLAVFVTVRSYLSPDREIKNVVSKATTLPRSPGGEAAHREASIVVETNRKGRCEERRFDNRTGKIVASNYVDCEARLGDERDTTPSENLSAERMRAILGAFKR